VPRVRALRGDESVRRYVTSGILVAALTLGVLASAARAQVPERSIDEIKAETQARAERGAYPLGGIDPADARDALSRITTRERDDWAAGWSAVADKYAAAAKTAATSAEKDKNLVRAWRLYYFAQWPTPASPGKAAAYAKALDAYSQHGQLQDPPLQVVKIPFEGKEITGYLRLPKGATGPVPIVLAISGLDSRKETVAETYAPLLDHGIGFFAVDGPGTGQAPLRVSPTAERMFTPIVDYLASRPEIDRTRILAHGVSFGGYWAAKLAMLEPTRLRGVVAQSAPVHTFFSEKFTREGTLGNREYLFDLAPAFVSVVDGANTVEDLIRLFPNMSLVAQGLIGRPTSPMLVIIGVKDTQVPLADGDILLHTGDVPKDAWVNPRGGHLGREAKGWTDPVIFEKVIMPWEIRMLAKTGP
jgi:esterase FrsA